MFYGGSLVEAQKNAVQYLTELKEGLPTSPKVPQDPLERAVGNFKFIDGPLNNTVGASGLYNCSRFSVDLDNSVLTVVSALIKHPGVLRFQGGQDGTGTWRGVLSAVNGEGNRYVTGISLDEERLKRYYSKGFEHRWLVRRLGDMQQRDIVDRFIGAVPHAAPYRPVFL